MHHHSKYGHNYQVGKPLGLDKRDIASLENALPALFADALTRSQQPPRADAGGAGERNRCVMDAPKLTFSAWHDDEMNSWCGIIEFTTPGLPTVKRSIYCDDTPERVILKCMGYAEELIKRHGSIDEFVRRFWKNETVLKD